MGQKEIAAARRHSENLRLGLAWYEVNAAKLKHHEQQRRESVRCARELGGYNTDKPTLRDRNLSEAYAGGKSSPPPRVDIVVERWCGKIRNKVETVWKTIAVTPKRWAAEPAGARPYGPRPYELRFVQEVASRIFGPKLSNDPCSKQRLRDFRTHIAERARHSGSVFLEKENPTPAQFARGVRRAELDYVEQYRAHDRIHWDYVNDGGFGCQDIAGTVERRREQYKRPLRPRRKPGPKPFFGIPMTGAEYTKRWRAKKLKAA
jgi:hypothetical protein